MRSEFSVVLDGPNTAPMILSQDIFGLRFKKIERGGFANVAFNLRRPLNAADFERFSDVAVYDVETGSQVGGGRLLNPGKGRSSDGEIWEVAAQGEGMAALQERRQPYMLYDTRDESWHQAFQSSKNATWDQGDEPGGSTEGVLLKLDQSIASGKRSDLRYYDMHESEQQVAYFAGAFDSGRTDTGNRIVAYASEFSTGDFVIVNTATGQAFDSTVEKTFDGSIGIDFTSADGIDNVFIRYERTGATFTAVESDWAHLRNLEVWAVRLDRDRLPITVSTAYGSGGMDITDAVIDVLARFCPTIDVKNAAIDPGTFNNLNLSSAAWMEGISPYEVLEAILDVSYDRATFEVWERQANGLYRFEYRPLPDYRYIRYEVPNPLDFQWTGSEDDDANEYWVMGTNSKGRTITSPQRFHFDPAERIRSKTLNLGQSSDFGQDASDLAGATHEDDQFLARSGRLKVGSKIFDRDTGRWAKPYEIENGYNMRILGLAAEQDSLNLDPAEGARVVQTKSNEYDVDAGVSLIEVNSPTPDAVRALASLTAFDSR